MVVSKNFNKLIKFISIIFIVIVAFKTVDFALSEITDIWAYEDATAENDSEWNAVYLKIENGNPLTDEDYGLIFSQTGLGKPAVDALIEEKTYDKILEYRDYYLQDKDFSCVRNGVFACHEFITDKDGNALQNPEFANLQDGDIIITLSIHSLGCRHGHAAIVTDAENGITAQAVMLGEKSALGSIDEWNSFPLVAVLRPKDVSDDVINEVVKFTEDKLLGIDYSLFSGIFSGRDTENIPNATHCAHLVWYAYKCYGIDLDSNGTRIVLPKDILHSDKLEIVQVYGNIEEL